MSCPAVLVSLCSIRLPLLRFGSSFGASSKTETRTIGSFEMVWPSSMWVASWSCPDASGMLAASSSTVDIDIGEKWAKLNFVDAIVGRSCTSPTIILLQSDFVWSSSWCGSDGGLSQHGGSRFGRKKKNTAELKISKSQDGGRWSTEKACLFATLSWGVRD